MGAPCQLAFLLGTCICLADWLFLQTRFRLTHPPHSSATLIPHARATPALQRESLRERHTELLRTHHEQFHPVWGQLMKTGYQNSRYAHQMER